MRFAPSRQTDVVNEVTPLKSSAVTAPIAATHRRSKAAGLSLTVPRDFPDLYRPEPSRS